jgi:hypothetical protein
MAIEIVSGFECPYCWCLEDSKGDDGEVYVDCEKAAWLREHHTDRQLHIHDEPDKLVLRFNNRASTPGPCHHAVFLAGIFVWHGGNNGQIAESLWELPWDWRSPEFLQCDQDAMMEALWELPIKRVVETRIRGVASRKNPYLCLPYRYNFFEQVWPDYRSVEGGHAMYSATVQAFFARDVQAFVSDLQANGFDAVERYCELVGESES